MTSENGVSPSALVNVESTMRVHPGGEFEDFDVCDSRTGEALATRSEPGSAVEVARFLNAEYAYCETAPAPDTLAHEIVCSRIGGPSPKLEAMVASGRLSLRCPGSVPVGPGWDHLYSEAR